MSDFSRVGWVLGLVVVLSNCGPTEAVRGDETATVSSGLGVGFEAREYGINRLWDQSGRQLLVPTGMYIIGSRSGGDNPDTNYWSKGGSATVLKNSHGDVGPAFSMQTRQVNPTTIAFAVTIGPLPFQMNTLSLTFDWDRNRIQRFKYEGSGFSDDCRPGFFAQTDVGYEELPQCHLIRNEAGAVVAQAGAAKVRPPSSWVEFTGDFEGKLRVSFSAMNGATFDGFFNHSGSHAFGLEFAEGAGSTLGATYTASGLIELLPAGAGPSTPVNPGPAAGDQLSADQALNPGESIRSPNGRFVATMQNDGNLVVYEGSRALWSSQTPGNPNTRAVMQADGNLVLYQNGNNVLWSSQTNGHPGAVTRVQDDGALVVLLNGTAIWSSGNPVANPTSPPTPTPTPTPTPSTGDSLAPGQELSNAQSLTSGNGRFRAVMQVDGNFVVYDGTRATWSTDTNGRSGVRAVMQTDGNFVLYQGGSAVWHTHTNGQPNAVLQLQDSGVLAVVLNGAVLWSSLASATGPSTPTPSPTPANPSGVQVIGGTSLNSNTPVISSNGQHRLAMQADGNLVLYSNGAVVWATGTNGRANTSAVMQPDGNFVLYEGTTPLWTTQTNGHPGAVLELRDDGALVVVQAGVVLWHR